MTKLPLRERRYKALLAQIARLTLARNKAIKMIVKAETLLPGLERRVRRLEFPTVKAKAETPIDPPKPNGDGAELPTGEPLDQTMIDEVTRLIGHPPSNPVKPKRRRRASPGSEQAALLHTPPSARKAKMEALGFRKV